jgi:hypothetical protein
VFDPAGAFINCPLQQESAEARLLYVALTHAEETAWLRSMPYGYPWNCVAPRMVIWRSVQPG